MLPGARPLHGDERRDVRTTRRRLNARDLWPMLKDTVRRWNAHNASRLAASLTCYALLSIAPLVVLCVALAGLAFGEQAARGEIAREIGRVVGPEAGRAVQAIVVNARQPTSGLVGTVSGLAVLLFGASGVFGELQSALNAIWGVETKPGVGLRAAVVHRLFSFAMVIAVAFLLLVSLVVSAGLAATGKFFEHYLPGGGTLWQIVNFAVALAITGLLFALIFKVVPEADIEWRDVAPGAFVTAILFSGGKLALGVYIGRSSFTSSYGAAGSLVALVLWVYYSSQIVFLGAEFTRAYTDRTRGRVAPGKGPVAVGGG